MIQRNIRLCFAFLIVTSIVILCVGSPSANAENGVSDTEILLGTTTNITGTNPSRALQAQKGAKLYFEKINRSGGINGRKIRVEVLDDAYDPRKAAEAASVLINEKKVFAIFQPYGTGAAKSVMTIAERTNVPLLFPFTGANFFAIPVVRNVFNFRARYMVEAASMVQFGLKHNVKDFSAVVQTGASGIDQISGLQRMLGEKRLKLLSEVALPNDTKNFDPYIAELMKKKPKAVVVGLLGQDGPEFVNRMIELGHKPMFLCFSPCLTDDFFDILKSTSGSVYIFQSTPILEQTSFPLVSEYLRETKAAGVKASVTGIEGYSAAKITVEGLQRCGKNLTRAELVHSFESSFKDFDIGGFKVSFSPTDHQGQQKTFVFKAEGGHLSQVRD